MTTPWTDIAEIDEANFEEWFVSTEMWQALCDNNANLNERIFAIENDTGGDTNLPIKGIFLWAGLAENVPSGFHICDGTNGLPDMRRVFPFGATLDEEVGLVGGNVTHTHENGVVGLGGEHAHGYSFTSGKASASSVAGSGALASKSSYNHYHGSAGRSTSSNGEHRHTVSAPKYAEGMPPYKCLYFIGRIS